MYKPALHAAKQEDQENHYPQNKKYEHNTNHHSNRNNPRGKTFWTRNWTWVYSHIRLSMALSVYTHYLHVPESLGVSVGVAVGVAMEVEEVGGGNVANSPVTQCHQSELLNYSPL